MYSKRELVIFCAGMEVFHTLTHIIFGLSHTLPITFFSISWTQPLNTFAILINIAASAGLLWWASRLND